MLPDVSGGMIMYSFYSKDQAVNLNFARKPVWHGLTAVVRLDDGSEHALQWSMLEETAAVEAVLDDRLRVRFSLEEVQGHLLISVKAQLTTGVSWPWCGWDPDQAIRLKIGSLGDLQGLCAHYLYNSWWTRPHFDQDLTRLPEKTQSLLYKDNHQLQHCLVYCDEALRSFLQGGEQGLELLIAPGKSGVRCFSGLVALLGAGEKSYPLIEKNVRLGRGRQPFANRQRDSRCMPEMFDYLGWCSWDACYLDVDEAAVLGKAAEFREKGVPVRWMLVDDGWSEECNRRLVSFREDRKKFPGGFRGVKKALEQDFGVYWLGAWHALTGHWEGVDAHGELAEMCDALDSERMLPPVDAGDAFVFWDKWHDYLARQGVDFIKVDVQSNLANHYRHRAFPGKVARVVHHALEASAALYFQGRLINCMGMAVDQLWHRPVSALARNSDDFFPKNPGNIREHALQNAYNSVFHDAFFQGDWDMWWTVHEDADAHALLRAVSGGPIYTSDPLGKTDAGRLMRLVFNDGRVVRCDGQGKVTEDRLFENPLVSGRLLKIANRVGDVEVLALFNINEHQQRIAEQVGLSLETDLQGQGVVYRGSQQRCFPARELPVIELGASESECLLFYPDEALVCLGLGDKVLPVCAVLDQRIYWEGSTVRLEARLRQGGSLLIYSQYPLLSIRVNAQDHSWRQEGWLSIVDCSEWEDEVSVECIADVS